MAAALLSPSAMARGLWQLLALGLGLQLLRHWGSTSFASPGAHSLRGWPRPPAPGRRARSACCRAQRGRPKKAADAAAHEVGAADPGDELDGEIAAFAEAVLPRTHHKKAKRQLVQRLQKLVQEVLDPRAQIFGFGSSFNGCGEASSDMDLAVYMPPEEAANLGNREALHRVARAASDGNFAVLEMRMGASVPIVVLEMLDDESGAQTGYTCDVSFQRLLPLHNTRLLRTYIELMPELAALIVVVKRWAKSKRIAGTWERFISTYSWTLMVIYYCQVCHGLPSLHALAHEPRQEAEEDAEHEGQGSVHDVDFVGLAAARRTLGTEKPCAYAGLGTLLRGFFQFYATVYDWSHEVVSVRLGVRKELGGGDFTPALRKTRISKKGRMMTVATFPAFNIEDPIEIERNLNFALKPNSLRLIYSWLTEAHIQLEAGAGLAEILGMRRLPKPQPRRGRRGKTPWLSGFMDLGRRPPCECGKCGQRFESFSEQLDHERECSHLERLLLAALG